MKNRSFFSRAVAVFSMITVILSISMCASAAWNPPFDAMPSAEDFDAIHADIVYPSRDSMYLEAYKTAVINRNAVYAFKDPMTKHDPMRKGNYYTVTKGTEVTVLAESSGYSCVIINETQKAGWINSDYLDVIQVITPAASTTIDDYKEDGKWVVARSSYYSKGELDYQYNYTYGEYGIAERKYWHSARDSEQETRENTIYHYDENGVNDYDTVWDEFGNMLRKNEFTRDDNGKIIQTDCYDQSGNLTSSRIMRWNTDGTIRLSEEYNNDNSLAEQTKYSYQDDGSYHINCVQYKSGKISSKSFSIFDSHDNLVSDEMTCYDDEENMFLKYMSSSTHDYDQNGKILKTTSFSSSYMPSFDRIYDLLNESIIHSNGEGAGDVLRAKSQNISTQITTYTYDSNENLILEVTTQDNEEITRTVTEYVYYSNSHDD